MQTPPAGDILTERGQFSGASFRCAKLETEDSKRL